MRMFSRSPAGRRPPVRVRRKFSRLFATAVALTLVASVAPAHADNVENDVVADGNGTINLPASGPGSTTVRYTIKATGADGLPRCDAEDGSPAEVAVHAPAAVTVSPATFTVSRCGEQQAVQFTAETAGSYSITVSVDDVRGSYVTNPAKFTLTVNARPTNTAPRVSVGGVEDGAEYEHGSVPTAVCNVTDAEDADASASPSLGDVTGPRADLGLGEQSATCSYTDAGGLTSTASSTYSVVDTRAPALIVPGDISVEADGPDGTVVDWDVSARDAVDPAPSVECTGGASGDTYPLGTTTILCSAIDAMGNGTTSEFRVTVVDTTAPELTLPEGISATATSTAGAVVDYAASAEDKVDTDVQVDCAPASGSTFAPGRTPVTCTATDDSGNKTSGSFEVYVGFDFAGFLAPVDNLVANSIKAGSTAPMKWRVPNGSGGWISSTDIVRGATSMVRTCGSSSADALEEYATGGTSLRYDSKDNQYIYNWQSPKKSGSCYSVTIELIDGSSHTAWFTLR